MQLSSEICILIGGRGIDARPGLFCSLDKFTVATLSLNISMHQQNGGYLSLCLFALHTYNRRSTIIYKFAAQYATLPKRRHAKLEQEVKLLKAINNKHISEAVSCYKSLLASVSQHDNAEGSVMLDRRTISQLIMQLRHSSQTSHLSVLKELVEEDMPQKLRLKPSHYEYHALMYAYGVHGKSPTTAYALIRRMKEQQGLEPNVYTYNTLLGCCKRSNDLRKAQQYFEEMLKRDIQPDAVTYNTMLHLLSKLRRFEEVFKLYSRMSAVADVYTFSIILDAAVKSNNRTAGLEVYRKLLAKTKTVRIDINTYNNMIRFVAAEMDVNEALDLFYRLQRQANEKHCDNYVLPDVFTYNIILDACLKSQLHSRAYMIFRDMKEQNIQPNAYTYGILLDAEFKNGGTLKSAIALFEEMCRKGIEPTGRFLNSLTNSASLGTAQLTELKRLLKIIKRYSNRFKLDANAYNSLLYGLALHGQADTVQALYDRIKAEGSFQPNIITYTHLTLAYVNNDDLDTALQIYHTIRREHTKSQYAGSSRARPVRLDTIYYSTILSALSSRGSPQNDNIASAEGNAEQDHTSFSLSFEDTSPSISRLSTALDLFNDMRPLRIQPSLEIYTIMLHLCGQYRDAYALHQVHQHLKVDLTLDPDIGIYNALMDAYNRVGDGDTVLDIWQSLVLPRTLSRDSSPMPPIAVDQTSVSIVLDSCGHNGAFQQAKLIWQFLKDRPGMVRLNTNNYNSYIECLCRSRGVEGWRMAYRVMKEEMLPPSAPFKAAAAAGDKPVFDKKTINTLISFAKKKGLNNNDYEELEKQKMLVFGGA